MMRLFVCLCTSILVVALTSVAHGQQPSLEIRARHPGETGERTLTVEGIEVEEAQPGFVAPTELAPFPADFEDPETAVTAPPPPSTVLREAAEPAEAGSGPAAETVETPATSGQPKGGAARHDR